MPRRSVPQPGSRSRRPHPAARLAAFSIVMVSGFAFLPPGPARALEPADSTALTTLSLIPQPGAPAPKLGGYLQVRELAQEHVGLTSYLNRARFSIDGALPSRFAYRFLAELEASAGARAAATVSLREATIKWSPAPFALTLGEFKTPFTREYVIPVPALELADLATVVDSLAPKYDVGFMAEVAIGATATISVGAFNGEGANAIANRDSVVMFVGRVTARPVPQLAVGASATRDGADSLRWGVDASAQYLGAVVRSEYVTRQRRGRAHELDDRGWYVFESFRLLPRLQLVARQEDFRRPARGPASRLRGSAYGTNVEIVPNRVRLLVQFSRRISGRRQLHSDGVLAQLQAQF